MPTQTPDAKPSSSKRALASTWTLLSTRLTQGPTYTIEDSWLLRIMVQLLVSVGIIATDIATISGGSPLYISLWAVPVSAVGATWSWYRRRSRNLPVKFCIAVAMMLALGMFFGRILAEQNDTRLALAELLIQLQVFHSFDLPRRKDLGYSMVIGLILLGVAATVSQTLAFAPFLLLFVALALPTIALDYRSRLGLLFKAKQRSRQPIQPLRHSIKRTLPLLALSVVLGLAIFAVMPRFQGYQLRMFPVSGQINVDGEFTGRSITNPGYVSEGNGSGGSELGDGNGQGQTFEEGPGEVNSESYYGFNSTMNQNLRGELTPKVVMRVRSQAEGFWRVLAFDQYTGQGWTISREEEEDIQVLTRPTWSLQFRLPWTPGLGRTREVIQTYSITADLPNLIPAMYEPKHLYFPTQEVARDPEGSLRSPVNLSDGLTYTVVSTVPYRDRSVLREASTTYTEAIRTHYLQLPEAIADPIREETERILAQSSTPLNNAYETALYLGQYLKQNYTVQPDLPFLGEDDDLAESFLFRTGGGYPDHFSTTMAVMLRSIGIPTRLVTGFAPGEFNPFTGFYVVRNVDAYALPEVYIPSYGWFTLDPIPGNELIPPSIEDYETFSVLQRLWQWVAGWLPTPIAGAVSGLFFVITSVIGRVLGIAMALLRGDWVAVFIGLAWLTGLAFVGWLAMSAWRAIAYRMWLSKLHPMDALYQQMLRVLAQQGVRKSPAQTPSEYAAEYAAQYTAQYADPEQNQGEDVHSNHRVAAVTAISEAYVRWRYGNYPADIKSMTEQLKTLRQTPLTTRSSTARNGTVRNGTVRNGAAMAKGDRANPKALSKR